MVWPSCFSFSLKGRTRMTTRTLSSPGKDGVASFGKDDEEKEDDDAIEKSQQGGVGGVWHRRKLPCCVRAMSWLSFWKARRVRLTSLEKSKTIPLRHNKVGWLRVVWRLRLAFLGVLPPLFGGAWNKREHGPRALMMPKILSLCFHARCC